ncbi:LuxR C-terminal-related transcriptional regulator [Ornithinimicrobium sp. F0845]|uniref:helix-turn-helix transcriptional regulator n=1 Tax=Ornithinimicrobium sp. F0845 TaxID=2926412 RepID=UPI001FF552A9|nr:LuxR C-terminal-related transcriptional regulator [Ornithinimicrobium sp. F0845]MCK0112058.1 LuxR C-terminal-related transcriptional regulator [Ornithinimicrobium sp. F0845]
MDAECSELTHALAEVLTDAGEDPTGAGVYAVLLTQGPREAADIAAALGTTPEALAPVTSRLIELGLVRCDHVREELLVAVSLDAPVNRIVAAAEASAATSIDRVARMRASSSEAARLLRQVQTLSNQEPESQTLDSASEVVTFLHQMNAECTTEVLALIDHNPSPTALRQSRDQDLALLEKGVRVRSIYLSSARGQPELMAYLRWLEEHGAQVALAPVVPVRTLVFDNRTALVARDPEDRSAGAVVVRSPGLVMALTWLFEFRWQQAETLGAPATPTDGPSAVELELLRHFAQGRKDAAIARRMDVSVRTIRRTVTQLSERLGVSSRFELGARAAEMGWITLPPTPMVTDTD